MEESYNLNVLLAKLRTPLHFNFICGKILKKNEFDCREFLNDLVEREIIEVNKNYYSIKNGKF